MNWQKLNVAFFLPYTLLTTFGVTSIFTTLGNGAVYQG
jgi:hypothetical protein